MPEVRASWLREDSLHLTLKFLGDIPLTNVEKLTAAVATAAGKVESFEIFVRGCGAFPLRGAPRVLWIGVDDPSGKLAEVQQALEQECAANGFASELRAFHPHLTIARIRQPRGSRELAAMHSEAGFNRETIRVSELTLIRSELGREGARHTAMSRHKLFKNQN